MSKQKIYISASPDELEYERETAADILQNLNFEPIFSHDYKSTSTDGGSSPIDGSDVVAFILWQQFQTSVRQEYAEAAQKGKPVVILVKLLKESETREPDLVSFLEEIKAQRRLGTTPFNVAHQYRHYRSLADFQKELLSGVTDEIDKIRSLTIHTTKTREGMYQLGTSIVIAAQDRLLIAQQTPSILVGPREYSATGDEKIAYEADFHDGLWEWIERVVIDKSRQCIVLYDLLPTKEEIRKHRLEREAKDRLTALKELEKKSGYRFKLIGTTERYSGPICIGDNWLAMWLTGKQNAFAVSFISKTVADSLADVLYQLASTPKPLSESASDLNI